ncbi:MAG: helix-turn-helix domain-containing protein [Hungatella sp.]
MSVGENIRNIRQEKGLTQAYVAKQAGITQAMLCQIERGTKNPSLQIGKEIADVLGCALDRLIIDNVSGSL